VDAVDGGGGGGGRASPIAIIIRARVSAVRCTGCLK